MSLFVLSIYIGIGFIIAAITLWNNWLRLKDDALPFILVIDSVLIAFFWGIVVIASIGVYLISMVDDSSFGKRMNAWIKAQYND